jgi:hypothetical protein
MDVQAVYECLNVFLASVVNYRVLFVMFSGCRFASSDLCGPEFGGVIFYGSNRV